MRKLVAALVITTTLFALWCWSEPPGALTPPGSSVPAVASRVAPAVVDRHPADPQQPAQALEPDTGVRVSGRAWQSTGKSLSPLPVGARLRVRVCRPLADEEPAVTLATLVGTVGEAGTFEIPSVPELNLVAIEFDADGLAVLRRDDIVLVDGLDVDLGDLLFAAGGHLRGIVRTQDGLQVAGASVAVWADRSADAPSAALSTADGSFVVTGIPCDLCIAIASHPDHGASPPLRFELRPSATEATGELVLQRERGLGGEIVAADERPVGDARVVWGTSERQRGPALRAFAQSPARETAIQADAQGRFFVANALPPGQLHVSAPGYHDAAIAVAEANGKRLRITLAREDTPESEGQLSHRADRSAADAESGPVGSLIGEVLGFDGEPLRVQLLLLDAGVTMSGADGRFRFDGVPAGPVQVAVGAAQLVAMADRQWWWQASRDARWITSTTFPFEVRPEETSAVVVAVARVYARLRGRVRAVDLSACQVRVEPVDDPSRRPFTRGVAIDGGFELPPLLPGGWRLCVLQDGRLVHSTEPILLAAGQDRHVDLWLAASSIQGRVATREVPLPDSLLLHRAAEFGAAWPASHALPPREALVGRDGSFAFDEVAAGSYVISGLDLAAGVVPTRIEVHAGGGAVTVEVWCARPGTLRIDPWDFTRCQLLAVSVPGTALRIEGGCLPFAPSPPGWQLPPGRYVLDLRRHEDGATLRGACEVEVVSGATSTVPIYAVRW